MPSASDPWHSAGLGAMAHLGTCSSRVTSVLTSTKLDHMRTAGQMGLGPGGTWQSRTPDSGRDPRPQPQLVPSFHCAGVFRATFHQGHDLVFPVPVLQDTCSVP